jgi:hypothetical protein
MAEKHHISRKWPVLVPESAFFPVLSPKCRETEPMAIAAETPPPNAA